LSFSQKQGLRILHRHDHEAFVEIVDSNLEDRRDVVGNLTRHRTERSGAPLRVDDRDRIAHPRAEIGCELRTDRDIVGPRLQTGERAGNHLVLVAGDILVGVAAREDHVDPAVEAAHQRLFDQRRGLRYARHFLDLVEHSAPVVQPPAIGLNDGMAVKPDDLVEQLGAKAVHHAHHDHQHGDREHDYADPDPGDHGNNRLASPGHHVALGNRPFEGGEDQATCPFHLCLRDA
jgi:hypothetical protein